MIRTAVIIGCLAVGLYVQPAIAAWEMQPQIEIGNRFETNPRLTRVKDLEDDANGQIVDAQMMLSNLLQLNAGQ